MEPNPSEWECSICYNLLLDPVVGKCGHDFCKSCLQSWAQACEATSKQQVVCPLCRTELAESVEGIKNMGVCVRLKRHLEKLYPDRTHQRRQERQAEDARAAAQRDARQQHIRTGRARYLRATRTRRSAPTTSVLSSETPSNPPSSLFSDFTTYTNQRTPPSAPSSRNPYLNSQPPALQLLPSSLRLRLLGTADLLQATAQLLHRNPQPNPNPSTHANTGAAALAPSSFPDMSQLTSGSSTWQAPATITFNMGWWEPSKESRRKRLASHRHRLAMLASAAATAAQHTVSAGYAY